MVARPPAAGEEGIQVPLPTAVRLLIIVPGKVERRRRRWCRMIRRWRRRRRRKRRKRRNEIEKGRDIIGLKTKNKK